MYTLLIPHQSIPVCTALIVLCNRVLMVQFYDGALLDGVLISQMNGP